MTKRILIAILAFFVLSTMSASWIHAGSMLTSPPSDSSDGLIIIGEQSEEYISNEPESEDELYVTLKNKMEKIWGPDVVRRKMQDEEEDGIDSIPSNLPRIMVLKKTSRPVKDYKYKHNFTSRHDRKNKFYPTTKYEYINITPIIVREAKKNGISPLLLKAVIQTESEFNSFAVSPAGALGLCQLMPNTAKFMKVRNPFDPEESIKGGAKYLALMKKMFKSLDLALAAYNAGPGTVSRSGGIPNISETRRYIVKVRKNMKW